MPIYIRCVYVLLQTLLIIIFFLHANIRETVKISDWTCCKMFQDFNNLFFFYCRLYSMILLSMILSVGGKFKRWKGCGWRKREGRILHLTREIATGTKHGNRTQKICLRLKASSWWRWGATRSSLGTQWAEYCMHMFFNELAKLAYKDTPMRKQNKPTKMMDELILEVGL